MVAGKKSIVTKEHNLRGTVIYVKGKKPILGIWEPIRIRTGTTSMVSTKIMAKEAEKKDEGGTLEEMYDAHAGGGF